MKIVCDTNVLISGILFDGNARQILDLAARGAVTNAISADILNEAQGVLLRPKFGLATSQVLGILELFRDTFETVIPDCPVAAITDDPDDNRILEALLFKFEGRPVGVKNIAVAVSEEVDTIEDVYEPFLIQEGYIVRTPQGRVATRSAYAHLGFAFPENGEQPRLL